MSDDFEGYHVGDITYGIDPATNGLFPVRVEKVGRKFLDVEPLDQELTKAVAPDFIANKPNRRFLRPQLPPRARFGGFDERIVNSKRESDAELRLLPTHYATYTNNTIKVLNSEDPSRWPLPTGVVYERWFQDVTL